MATKHSRLVMEADMIVLVVYMEVLGQVVASSSQNMLILTVYFVPLVAQYRRVTQILGLTVSR